MAQLLCQLPDITSSPTLLSPSLLATTSETLHIANRIAAMPRFALALTKKAINQAEDRMGLRDTMDATFALHHLAHAHNAMTSEDHLAGQDAKSMAKSLK